ncbi:hypothetical protein CAEBREN_29929 [Caenorhabditis brenneri]|uniref:B box-type domain-containing protein n=1 Tax=Caenorhabditis brenneri TaxID=135651 RepID=G0M6U5_CAEBE|nr:hypothetical protein CAEBREN_29929 [Caenorhabditis brenneri]
MGDRPFTSSTEHVLLFSTMIKSTQTFKVNCSLEDQFIQVLSGPLPPGITIRCPSVSAREIDISFHYNPVENSLVEENNDRKTVVIRVEYLRGDGCNFSIDLGFEKEKKSRLIECPICNSEFDREKKTPKVMECGHTLCEECLTNLFSVNKELNSNRDTLPVPLCCPYDRQHIHKSIVEMATNESLLDAIDAAALERATEYPDTPKIVSDPCLPCYENDKHEAAHWCEDCKEAYCGACFLASHKPRVMADHKRASLSEMPMVIPKCPWHPENDAVFVCLKLSCKIGHTLYCLECEKNELHKDHNNETVKQRLTRNMKSLEDLQKRTKETKETLEINTHSVHMSLVQFGEMSSESMQARKRIMAYHQREQAKDLTIFENWRQRKEDELTDKKRTIFLNSTKANAQSKKIEKTLKRKVDIHDIRDMLEEGNDFCQKTEKIITFPKVLSAVTSEGKFKYKPKKHKPN